MIKKGKRKKILRGISFITTVYNEEKSIDNFLESLVEQTFLPSEVVIVDGGSADSTYRKIVSFFKKRMQYEKGDERIVLLEDYEEGSGKKEKLKTGDSGSEAVNVKILKKSGANISGGRNAAISNASGRIICASDAGCILDKNWLLEITLPYNDPSCNVVGGASVPFCKNFFQKCLAVCIMPSAGEITGDRYMPSSRNISFRKKIWADVGGYPEDMDYGEDMKFNFNIKKAGYRIRFNPGAVVYWKMRENPVEIFWQFFRYARGDARGKMYTTRHIIRFCAFLVFILVIFAGVFISKWVFMMFVPLFAIYVFKPYSRLFNAYKAKDSCYLNIYEKVLSILFIPLLLLYIDFSKMCGYINGLLKI